jgi:hypothetical protein
MCPYLQGWGRVEEGIASAVGQGSYQAVLDAIVKAEMQKRAEMKPEEKQTVAAVPTPKRKGKKKRRGAKPVFSVTRGIQVAEVAQAGGADRRYRR